MNDMSDEWKVPKALHDVTMWVHPEGRVSGSLFVHLKSRRFEGPQRPLEVLNNGRRFLVLQHQSPDELRFYNRSAIVRVEYVEEVPHDASGMVAQRCQVHLMDDCLIEGTMMKSLPPDRSRLFDFLNLEDEPFMTIYGEDGNVCMVNKSYIVCVKTPDE